MLAYVSMLSAAGLLVIESDLQPGLLMAATLLFTRVVGSFDAVFFRGQRFAEVAAASCYLVQFGTTSAVPVFVPIMARGELHLEGVTFAAASTGGTGSRERLLRDVDLSLKPGHLVFVCGPPASGKSLLAGLAVGIIPPTGGRVLLDEWDLQNIAPTVIAQNITYGAQEGTLPHGSIAEIISCGRIAPAGKIVEAAVRAGVHSDISALKDGYNHHVDGLTTTLPFGFRRKLAIARALFDPPTIIVLDDPSLGLSTEDRSHLLCSLAKLRDTGHALLVCSGDDSFATISDEIYQVVDGMVVSLRGRASGRPIAAIARARG